MEAKAEGRIFAMALPSPDSEFVAVTPCRVVDTRNPAGPFGGPAFTANQVRTFNIPAGPCGGIPVASAYSLNIAIVNYDTSIGTGGFVTAYPAGTARPNTANINFGDGIYAVSNAAIVPAEDGSISVFSSGATHIIIDINGYFPVAIARDHVLLCGSSVRDITPYIPGYPVVELRTGCVPSSTTLAMLVTRGGVVSTANLASYLDGGGIVIGEFSNNDELFNQAFGTAVVQGAFIGACGDHISPEVQKGTSDPLWESVAYAAPPSGGCGNDMQLFPGITILGGWTAVPASVSLAYRDRNAGRLWLLEADWQDSQTNSGFTPNEIEMFKYMMTHK